MDPNHGCPYDALKVFCNFTAGGTTCLDPLKPQKNMQWKPEKKSTSRLVSWFSQQHGGNKFDYAGLDVVQLRFLRLHSHSSFQHMTISCIADLLSSRCTTNSVNKFFHILGNTDKEISSHFITESRSGCVLELVVRTVGSTELHCGDMELLPVRDVGFETGEALFNVTVVLGPLCFL
ncbi:collagen alpha-1(V) chain-like [Eucyclogobius newberryi]|uniref:collagen alpha-1(V) chain-like n=1 Tax=Eucyclogobius newberryi TaxID=166745 RepID=UPI003B5B4990